MIRIGSYDLLKDRERLLSLGLLETYETQIIFRIRIRGVEPEFGAKFFRRFRPVFPTYVSLTCKVVCLPERWSTFQRAMKSRDRSRIITDFDPQISNQQE